MHLVASTPGARLRQSGLFPGCGLLPEGVKENARSLARGPNVFPQAPVFANAIGGRRLPQPERAAQGGGWQGRREGGAEVGRRERGGGRQSSAAPCLVSAGWRWLRVPLRWCSPSQALRPPSLPRPSAEASRSPARRWACAR